MILIDTNALIVLLIGIIDPRLFKTHKRTSIYDEEDFNELVEVVEDFERLVVLPNIWTEVDNLLNDFSGEYKNIYVKKLIKIIKLTSERYICSAVGAESDSFYDLGLTDSLILDLAKDCEMLITADSRLSDYANANDILVYDMIKEKNRKLF